MLIVFHKLTFTRIKKYRTDIWMFPRFAYYLKLRYKLNVRQPKKNNEYLLVIRSKLSYGLTGEICNENVNEKNVKISLSVIRMCAKFLIAIFPLQRNIHIDHKIRSRSFADKLHSRQMYEFIQSIKRSFFRYEVFWCFKFFFSLSSLR